MKATDSAPTDPVSADGAKFLIAASRYNGAIVQQLVDGAVDALVTRGADREDLTVVWVAGALELPVVALAAANTLTFDGIVCLGCVIQGDTDHYEHVCRATVDGLMQVSVDCGVPIGNGVLTVATLEQARERAGGDVGNKGAEAAIAVLEANRAIDAVKRAT